MGREATLRLVVRGLLLAGILALVLAAGASASIDWAKLGPLQTGKPPWRNDSQTLPRRIAALGLHALGQEGAAMHIHQHLDLYVGGRHVTVPAAIGIDFQQQFITEVHTHDTSGVIHVESPTVRPFTLGQFFGEWGVKLTSHCVGRYCGHVRWWVNGHERHGDPASLVLRGHQEIAVAAGPPPFQVPRSYAFPFGE
jgi:hypothetical protein